MLNVLVETLEVYSAVYVDAAAMGVVALVDVGLPIQPCEAHTVVVVVFRSSWYGSDVYTHCVGSKLVISAGWTVPSPISVPRRRIDELQELDVKPLTGCAYLD